MGHDRRQPDPGVTEPSAGALVGREHQLPVRVYYEDTDFTGVVYYGNYARFLERGRSDFLRLAGVSHTELFEADAAFVVTRLEIDFKRPARIDDALLVRTTYDTVSGPRMAITQTITRGAELIVSAKVSAACIDLKGRPRRPSPDLHARLKPYLLPQESRDRP